MKLEITWRMFEKYSNTKFHENPFSGSRVVPCGRADMQLIVFFRSFTNAPKKAWNYSCTLSDCFQGMVSSMQLYVLVYIFVFLITLVPNWPVLEIVMQAPKYLCILYFIHTHTPSNPSRWVFLLMILYRVIPVDSRKLIYTEARNLHF
jgi:hypothetical protein